jgi:tetratricopeptide (TPR) repeat protein
MHCARLLALFAASIFLIHPVQATTLHQIANRSSLLCFMFYFMGLLIFLHQYANISVIRKIISWLCITVLFLLALGSKSIAISMPFSIVFVHFFNRKNNKKDTVIIIFCAFFITLIATFVLFRNSHILQNTIVTSATYFYTQCVVFYRYVLLCLFPLNVIPEYLQDIKTIIDLKICMAFLGVLSFVYGAIWLIYKKNILGLALIFFIIMLLPSSSFIPRDNMMLIQRLYMPMAGFSMGLAFICLSILQLFSSRAIRQFLYVIFFSYFVFLIISTLYVNCLLADNLAFWQIIQKRFPNNHIPDLNIGAFYLRENNPDAALDVLNEAMKKNRLDSKVWYNIGVAYLFKGDFDRALRNSLIAHELDPLNTLYFVNIGNIYFSLKEYDKAIEWYKRYLKRNLKNADVYYNLSLAYMHFGDYDSALTHIEKALSLKITRLNLENKVKCLIQLQHFDLALSVIDSLDSKYGSTENLLFYRGLIAQKTVNPDAAIMYYKEILKQNNQHVAVLLNCGVLYFEKKEYSLAKEYWEKVLKIDPNNPSAKHNLKRLYSQ